MSSGPKISLKRALEQASQEHKAWLARMTPAERAWYDRCSAYNDAREKERRQAYLDRDDDTYWSYGGGPL